MTIAEYNLYVAKQGLGMNSLSNHSYGLTAYFFALPPHTPNTSKKDSDFDKILDDLFRTGAKNIKQMGHDIVQDTPATKLILDELLEEVDDEILNVAMIDEEAAFNPTKDLEELERLLAMIPQSNFT
ncbi:hypothetical protein Tco_1143796 [Tanacetum coccineum]